MKRIMNLAWPGVIPLLLLALFLISGLRAVTAQSNQLKITYLNVGQGDSALIHGPDGFDVLIDGGETDAGPTVAAYLRSEGVDDVDVLLASHNDSDHIGGLVDVLNMADIPVAQVLYNGYDADSNIFRQFATAAALEGAALQPAQYPAAYTWGAASAYILNPLSGLTGTIDQNNASVMVLLVYGDQKFLFPGDIEAEGELAVLLRGTPSAAQVLKVAHHGSDTSTGAEFLAAVQPTDAVISVGAGNSYGHPDLEVLDRLKSAGVRTWRTDQNWNIWLTTDGVSYNILAQIMNPVYLPVTQRNFCLPTGSGQMQIQTIFYNGVVSSKEPDEYVEFGNWTNCPTQLSGWQIADQSGNAYLFPTFVIQPGQVCRLYTNEDHPEWCGFNWHKGNAVWSNSGECGSLMDPAGYLIDEYCYP